MSRSQDATTMIQDQNRAQQARALLLLVAVLGASAVGAQEPGSQPHEFLFALDQKPVWMDEAELLNTILDQQTPFDHGFDLTGFPPLPEHPPTPHPLLAPDFPAAPRYRDVVQRLVALARPVAANNIVTLLEKYQKYQTRYYKTSTGIEAALWLLEQVEEVGKAGKARGFPVEVAAFQHERWEQVSIVARVKGAAVDPVTVVVGCHLDSLARGSYAPGADDDGSGTGTTLELLRAVIAGDYRPNNTLEFHWYAAEEPGMLGSQDIALHYKDADVPVAGYLNLDMIAYAWDGDRSVAGLIAECSDPGLNKFIKMLFAEFLDIGIVDTSCRYICGDHCSWSRRAGVRTAFPFESPFGKHNPHIHTGTDLVEKLDFERYGFEWVKLGLAYLVELGA